MSSISSDGTTDVGTMGAGVSFTLRVESLRAGLSAGTLPAAFPVGVGTTLSPLSTGAVLRSGIWSEEFLPPFFVAVFGVTTGTMGAGLTGASTTTGLAVFETTGLSGTTIASTTTGVAGTCGLRLRELARALRAALMFSSFIVKSPLQKKQRDARLSDAPET